MTEKASKYICEVCGFKAVSKREIREHIKEKHSDLLKTNRNGEKSNSNNKPPIGIKILGAILGVLISLIIFSLSYLVGVIEIFIIIIYFVILYELQKNYENTHSFKYYIIYYTFVCSAVILIMAVILIFLLLLGVFSTAP